MEGKDELARGNRPKQASSKLLSSIFLTPKFSGENPRGWVRKCNKLFSHHYVPYNQKVYLATMHLDGDVEIWYFSFVEEQQELKWEQLVEEIYSRFSPEARLNSIAELKKLQQIGSVDDYWEKFEEF